MLPCVMPEAFGGDSNSGKLVYLLEESLGSHSPLSVRLVSGGEQVMHEPICSVERNQHHTSAWKSVSLERALGWTYCSETMLIRGQNPAEVFWKIFQRCYHTILQDARRILCISKIAFLRRNCSGVSLLNRTIIGPIVQLVVTFISTLPEFC